MNENLAQIMPSEPGARPSHPKHPNENSMEFVIPLSAAVFGFLFSYVGLQRDVSIKSIRVTIKKKHKDNQAAKLG